VKKRTETNCKMSLLLYTSSEDATENVKFSASQHQSNDELK